MDENNNAEVTQEDLLTALGPDFLDTTANTDEGTQGDNNQGTNQQTTDATDQQQQQQTDNQQTNQDQHFNNNRQNQAFARMRTENNQYKNMLTKLGESIGIKGGNLESTMQALQTALLQRQSEQQNIPLETLQRIENLERQNAVYQQDQLKQQALLGFENLKKEMNLKDEELREFATSLSENGIDPFTTKVDLVREYKLLNFDKLIAKAREEGIAEEAQRATKAAQHSTTPSSGVGAKADKVEAIKSISDLNALLSQKLN